MTRLSLIVAASLVLMGAARADTPVVASGLQVKHWTTPEFPHRASQDAVRCVVAVELDARGRPTDTRVSGCEEPFASASTRSVTTWRWHPPRIDGVSARGRALVSVVMVRKQASSVPPPPDQCDHRVGVGADGAILPEPPDPASLCVAAFPDRTAPPPVAVSCSFDVRHLDGERVLALDRCPAEAHAWLEALVDGGAFAPAEWNTVWIEASP